MKNVCFLLIPFQIVIVPTQSLPSVYFRLVGVEIVKVFEVKIIFPFLSVFSLEWA